MSYKPNKSAILCSIHLAAFTLLVSVATPLAADALRGDTTATQPLSSPIRIMLMFTERTEENESVRPYARLETEVGTDRSWTATSIEQWFSNEFADEFEIVVASQREILRRNNVDFGKLSGEDLKLIQQAAVEHDADYYVCGFAEIIGPVPIDDHIPGQRVWRCAALLQMRMYRSDNGVSIPLKDQPAEAVDIDRHYARRKVARKIGPLVGPKMVKIIREQFARREAIGHTLDIYVRNCDGKQLQLLKVAIKNAIGSEPDRHKFERGVATFRAKCRCDGADIASRLAAQRFEGFSLEIEEATSDVIRLKMIPL